MTGKQIAAIAEELRQNGEFEYYGIRTQEEAFELGEIDHLSHVWNDGDDTGEELDGISCTAIASRAVSMHGDGTSTMGTYYGEHIAIIAGNDIEYGEDEGEIIIKDATVVKIIK